MGTGERYQLMRRLHDMEQTIAVLHHRVSRLQHELIQSRRTPIGGFLKGSCLRALFTSGKQTEMAAGTVRQNRRVERHAASLF
jgi:hypothetical protein